MADHLSKILLRALRWYLHPKMGLSEFQSLFEDLHQLALGGMWIGAGSDVADSGESLVLQHLARGLGEGASELMIFDVGANQGQFARLVVDALGERCRVHCFEPARDTFSILQKRVEYMARVGLHNVAMGDTEGEAVLHTDTVGSGLASLYLRRLDHFGIQMQLEERVKVTTLDRFCRERGIRRIDLLKLDVEGNELNVLKGGQAMIAAGAIPLIQFEFGGCNIDSRTFLQDFHYLLGERYELYRIVRDGWVPLVRYQERLEAFLTTNYLAVTRRPQDAR